MRQKNEFCLELRESQGFAFAKHVAAKYKVPAWICMDVGLCNNSHVADVSQEEWTTVS